MTQSRIAKHFLTLERSNRLYCCRARMLAVAASDSQPAFEPARRTIRQQAQVNTFQSSSQSAAAIDQAPDGSFVAVWHSRRQQNGTYGIYLQRYDRQWPCAIGAETQVNLYTRSMQMNPSIAVDPSWCLGSLGIVWPRWLVERDYGPAILQVRNSKVAMKS